MVRLLFKIVELDASKKLKNRCEVLWKSRKEFHWILMIYKARFMGINDDDLKRVNQSVIAQIISYDYLGRKAKSTSLFYKVPWKVPDESLQNIIEIKKNLFIACQTGISTMQIS